MRALVVLFAVYVFAGCGGAASAPVLPAPQPAPQPERPLLAEGLLGTIDEEEVQSVFDRHRDELLGCYAEALEELEELEGEIEIAVRVSRGGTAEAVYLSRSSVGSSAVESCVVRKVASFGFPAPSGGPAELSYPLALTSGVRPPRPLSASVLADATAQHESEISACLGSASEVEVTLYIDVGGRVLSAGGGGTSTAAFEAAQCIARSAAAWTLSPPGASIAKGALRF